ncbi:DUF4149 domain-containing protein [Halorussus litoreus]|uniref:DUF4149 domain-containing protein n=1 Tax=Halorussus litoreus TaxID=1710536 RepID=UPI000E274CE4|nr:DUF4149 domain-containing protein [Halorussus litoreus]
MSVLQTGATVVLDTALGVWLGSIIFFSFVAAPTTFDVLGDDAGQVVNAIFPKYYAFGGVLGAIAFPPTFVADIGGPLDGTVVSVLVLGGLALNLYARNVLIPKMDRAGDDAFAQYHKQSVVLNGVTMLAVTAALVLAHL